MKSLIARVRKSLTAAPKRPSGPARFRPTLTGLEARECPAALTTVSATGDVAIQIDADSQTAQGVKVQDIYGGLAVNGVWVKVNGKTFAASAVRSLTITGSDLANKIDLLSFHKHVFTGLKEPVKINLGGGNDYIDASQFDDVINGQAGNDTLHGYSGNDLIDGGLGADFMTGGDGVDTVRGGDGNDIVWGSAGNDILQGGAGNDTMNGDSGNDAVYGQDGDDALWGGHNDDTLYGGAGADWYHGDDRGVGYGYDVAVDDGGWFYWSIEEVRQV